MSSASSRSLAFTLLEVLAAVAILALVYTVLARVGIQGFRAEGGSDRRLRASLLADDMLAEIEGQLEMGSAPPLGEKDAKRDEFLVHLRVSPAEIEIPPASEAAVQRLRAAAGKQAGGASSLAAKLGANGTTPSFFQPQAPGEPPPGRRIELRVSWLDGATEAAVTRETYGLDQSAAQSLLLALDMAAQAEKQAAAGEAGAVPQPAGPASPTGAAPAASPAGATSPGMGPTP
jgi:prepilin-type N-terminal cleavage/methylation domain-containing protein